MTELKKKKTPGYSHRQIAPPATSFTSAPQFPVWRNLFSGPYPPPKKKTRLRVLRQPWFKRVFLCIYLFILACAAENNRRREARIFGSSVRPSVRYPSVNTYSAWHDISSRIVAEFQWNLVQVVSMWVAIAEKVFQGQRSKVKVTSRPNALLRRRLYQYFDGVATR